MIETAVQVESFLHVEVAMASLFYAFSQQLLLLSIVRWLA